MSNLTFFRKIKIVHTIKQTKVVREGVINKTENVVTHTKNFVHNDLDSKITNMAKKAKELSLIHI